MALQMQTFHDFTPQMYEAFKTKILKDTGVEIKEGTEGTVTHGSFQFTYNYNSTTQVFQVQCLKKPLFIKASTIVEGLAEEIAQLIADTASAPAVAAADTSEVK